MIAVAAVLMAAGAAGTQFTDGAWRTAFGFAGAIGAVGTILLVIRCNDRSRR